MNTDEPNPSPQGRKGEKKKRGFAPPPLFTSAPLLLLMASLTLQPIAEAVAKIGAQTPVGSTLNSAEWAQVPVEIRNRAIFSSKVENARVLDRIKAGLENMLAGNRNQFGVIEDRSKFIADLRQLAEQEGLAPQDPALKGTIQDITSHARAELILKTQTEMAYGYARHKRGSTGPALRAEPAQELIRIEERKEKRRWVDLWRAHGGRTFEGDSGFGELQPGMGSIRCIALKGDPIWSSISRFGNPYPPFDFGSGIGVEAVSRTEAIRLGLIQRNQITTEVPVALNENVEVDVAGMDPTIQSELMRGLEGLADLVGTVLKWKRGVA